MDEIKEKYEVDVSRLHKHYDAKLNEIKKKHEKAQRDILVSKKWVRSMADIVLLKAYRDLIWGGGERRM